MSFIKLKEYCKNHSISYNTGYRWFKNKQITGAYKTDSGTILIPDTFNKSNSKFDKTDAIALLLDRSIEFTNNEASILDFTAYILSHFNFTFISDDSADNPRYSKMMPKSEVVQNHFKQFIPKGEKPKINTFVPEDAPSFTKYEPLTIKETKELLGLIKDDEGLAPSIDLKKLPEKLLFDDEVLALKAQNLLNEIDNVKNEIVLEYDTDLKYSEIAGGVVSSDNLTPQFNYTASNSSPDDPSGSNQKDLDPKFTANFKLTKKELEQKSLPVKTKRTRKDKRNSK